MRLFADLILCAAGALVFLPALVVLVETLAALLPPQRERARSAERLPSCAVLVPAHDETAQIARTVSLLLRELPPGGRLVVVADNCSDDTAAVAARAGATVVARNDRQRIGKGFAISFGLRHLDADPPEVVVVVDADCQVSAGGLATLVAEAAGANRPIQAEYLLSAPANASPKVVVSALATLLRNRVRPRGLLGLGLPCHLTGSGMAFPWKLLREAPETGDNLVEDLVLGIELGLRGAPPRSCPEVQIHSELPRAPAANLGQRRRWEHGHLRTLATYAPKLIVRGIMQRRRDLLALGLDLGVPPLALLVMTQLTLVGVSAVAGWMGLASFAGFGLAVAAMATLFCAVATAWAKFGRRVLPLRQLLFVPLYLLWKAPLYAGLARGRRQPRWERTARDNVVSGDGDRRPGSTSAFPS